MCSKDLAITQGPPPSLQPYKYKESGASRFLLSRFHFHCLWLLCWPPPGIFTPSCSCEADKTCKLSTFSAELTHYIYYHMYGILTGHRFNIDSFITCSTLEMGPMPHVHLNKWAGQYHWASMSDPRRFYVVNSHVTFEWNILLDLSGEAATKTLSSLMTELLL